MQFSAHVIKGTVTDILWRRQGVKTTTYYDTEFTLGPDDIYATGVLSPTQIVALKREPYVRISVTGMPTPAPQA